MADRSGVIYFLKMSPNLTLLSSSHTNSVSSIERGDDDERTQAYYQYVEECEEETTKLYD